MIKITVNLAMTKIICLLSFLLPIFAFVQMTILHQHQKGGTTKGSDIK